MGMGAAQDLSPQHAGLREVGTEGGPARHLVLAVRPQRALADPLVVRAVGAVCRHRCSSRSVLDAPRPRPTAEGIPPNSIEIEAHPRVASRDLVSILQGSSLRTTAKHAVPVCLIGKLRMPAGPHRLTQ